MRQCLNFYSGEVLMIEGVLLALEMSNILWALVGVVIGVLVGAVPGLTATMGIALAVPVTFVMSPESGMIMLCGIYAGGIYGGAITAILINIPGAPGSIPTMWDGYPLTQQGKSTQALTAAAISSAVGGLFSGIVLFSLSPVIAQFALKMSPAEYTALILFGLVAVSVMIDTRLLASITTLFLGISMSLIGIDPVSGFSRYTFGQNKLAGGLGIVPVLVGVFVVVEAVRIAHSSVGRAANVERVSAMENPTRFKSADLKSNRWNLVRSSVLGTAIGILPAMGPESTPFISYMLAKRASKTPERFGRGSLEGIVAAESSNNANVGGSLIPLLTLGIPGSGAAAVFVGALTLHGLRPGPMLFVEQKPLMYALFTGFIVVNLFMLVLSLSLVRKFALILRIPKSILATFVALLAIVGTYAMGANAYDVRVMLVSGVLAALLLLLGLPLAPLVLGLILGPLLEVNLFRALAMSRGQLDIFYKSPFVLAVVVLTCFLVWWSRRMSVDKQQIMAKSS